MTKTILKMGCGEYGRYTLRASDGLIYLDFFTAGKGVALTPTNTPGETFVDIAGALYSAVGVSKAGNAYVFTQGFVNPVKIIKDAAGNPFTGNTACAGLFGTYITVRNGQLWYWGSDDMGLFGKRGAASITAPVQLPTPAGVTFTKVRMGNIILALDTTGTLWQCNMDKLAFTKVNLPGVVDLFAISWTGFYVAVINGNPYGWGAEGRYLGLTGDTPTPVPLKDVWGLQAPITAITANHNVIHFIDNTGQLWGMGDNANGEVGDGVALVNRDNYVNVNAGGAITPYSWSWAKYGLMYPKPVKVAVGIVFTDIWADESYAFYHYAQDVNGVVYSWGRQKSWVQGINWNNSDKYPNAYDIYKPAPIDLFNKSNVQMPDFALGSISLSNQNVQGATATFSATVVPPTARKIAKYDWLQLTGTPIGITGSGNSVALSGLTAGNYSIRLVTTDENGGMMHADTSIAVTIPNQPPIAAIVGLSEITLPTNSVDLSGLPSSDPDGTIVGWSWSEVSGPAPANFTVLSGSSTKVTDLQAGEYVFGLQVIDNGGLTSKATLNVTVHPAPTITSVDIHYSDNSTKTVN